MNARELKPVLTEGQWERVLTTEEVPELQVDETLGLLVHKLGWFHWDDAFQHRRIGEMMEKGVRELKDLLAEVSTVKTNPEEYFELQKQLSRIRQHQGWHYDMANRIAALLPPPPLLDRLKQEQSDESKGVEEGDHRREGSFDVGGDSGGRARQEAVASSDREGEGVPPDGGEPGEHPQS